MKLRLFLALIMVVSAPPVWAQNSSKAVFAQAQREPRGSARAIDLYQRYVKLEPSDAWGYLALAEAHANAREFDEAFAALARAETLAPREEDVAIVRTRIQRAHRNALPSIKPISHVSRDSDGNSSTRIGAAGDVSVSGAARLGMTVTRTMISDGSIDATADHAGATLVVKTATVRWNTEVGVARIADAQTSNMVAAQTHVRWSRSASAPVFDLRLRNAPLTAAYPLVAAEAKLSEARGVVDVPISMGLKLRAAAQVGSISVRVADSIVRDPVTPGRPGRNPNTAQTPRSNNQRLGIGGGLVRSLSGTAELSVNAYRLSYAEPASGGYFAPERVDQLELGTYIELYRFDPLTIALDAGVGVQRAKLFAQPVGGVSPSARFWGMLSAPLAERLELNIEVDAYKSQLSTVATSESWSSIAGGLSLRWLID
jgi:hypothetical protein